MRWIQEMVTLKWVRADYVIAYSHTVPEHDLDKDLTGFYDRTYDITRSANRHAEQGL